jgi:integrase
MFLSELVSQYVLERNEERDIGRELSPRTAGHLLDCAAVYSRYLKRRAVASDLTAAGISELLIVESSAGRSPYTIKNRRTGLRVLRNFALRKGWVDDAGKTIRKVFCPPLDVDGYDLAKMSMFADYLAGLTGTVRHTGIPRAVYWESLLLTAWELGLRIGDMPRIESQHFQRDGWLFVSESKTGKGGWMRIRPSVTEAIVRCIDAKPNRQYIWPALQG